MNERIKELLVQATAFARENVEYSRTEGFDLFTEKLYVVSRDKFAELIVRECAEQIIAKGTDWVDFAPSQTGVRPEYWDMAQQIKQHFGVEE